MPRCMLQANTHALTLKNHVCRNCNSSFYFETFFSELTDVALMNQQVKRDSDNVIIPDGFFAADFSKCRINGKDYLRPYISSVQIERSIAGNVFCEFSFDENAQRQLLRGMAKIGLNALLVKFQRATRDFRIVEHEDTIFSGHEDELAPLKRFINGEISENRFVGRLTDLDDPCLVELGNRSGNRISPNQVSHTRHIVDIHRYEGCLFCFVTLFLGLENPGAVYCISLNRELPVELPVEDEIRLPSSTHVRTIQFNYRLSGNSVVKKRTERLKQGVIQPVNNITWIGYINNRKI